MEKFKRYIKVYLVLIIGAITTTGCFDDLNTIPLDEDIVTSGVVYDDPDSYIQVLAKLYAGLAVSGQQGPAGQVDIQGIDEGFGQYLRGYWYHQELPTDEAVIGWNDQTIHDFHEQDWTSRDPFIFAFYSRIFYQVALCNEFIRETSDEKLDSRDVDAQLRDDIQGFRAEARFLRALSYFHALDLFRNVPFVTENDIVGNFFPEQTNANDLFAYIEAELLDIEADIAGPKENQYGRADRAAVWMLLAKLYLNAEVYVGSPKYTEALDFAKRIIDAGYELDPDYESVFKADNHNATGVIFPVTFDGVNTRTWGGMTFIIRAGIGGEMDPLYSGVSSGWGGTRTTREFVGIFPNENKVFIEPNEGNTKSYPKVYIPATYNDFDAGDTENSLSSIESDGKFEGYKYFPTDNSEFLITTIPSLALQFGDDGADGTLEQNGARIVVPEAGLYFFNVDMNEKTYSLEKQSIGVIGDATEGGWEDDLDMAWDEELQALIVKTSLSEGGLKFRANDAWDVNFGDNDADAVLERDGDDIIIEKAGTYEIILFLDKPDYTFQINFLDFDRRKLFYTEGQNLDITDITQFTEGYGIRKFRNVTSAGDLGSDTDFPDTDFPMFRIADAYLMAAEAILRGASGGSQDDALAYVNAVRERAFQGGAGTITSDVLNLDYILDERGRELYWECHRRTDLIRFNKFSNSSYIWQWKGGSFEGASVDAFRDVFPIPSADINANPNLQQNAGY